MLYIIKTYETISGKRPLKQWLDNLCDRKARVNIDMRLERLEEGNFGKYRSVGGGVYELKIDVGQGYRVYFGKIGLQIILLLCGGDKGSQVRDIAKAKEYFADFKTRRKNNA